MSGIRGLHRFVEILLEIASARSDNAESKVTRAVGRHSIRCPNRVVKVWPLSKVCLLRLRPSARPELPGGFQPYFLVAAAQPGSLAKLVFARQRCVLSQEFDFE